MDTLMEADYRSSSPIETQDTVFDTEDAEFEDQDTEIEDDHATPMEAENTIQSSSLLQSDDTEVEDHQAPDNSFQEHKPSVNKPRAMLSLSISNIPLTWDEENIKAYIKEHVTTNENVTEDIETIYCDKVSRSGVSHKWVVTFKTADVFVEALTILKQNANESVPGMKFLVDYYVPHVKPSHPQVTDGRNRSRSRSPIGSLKEEQNSPDNSTEVSYAYMNCKILNIRNLPFCWTKIKVKDYLRKQTRRNPEFLSDIQEIILDEQKLRNGTRFVKLIFKNASICHATKALLTKLGDKIANNKVFAQFPLQIEQMSSNSAKKEENRVIIMTRVPRTWNKSNVNEYIKQHTSTEPELIKNIQYIFMESKNKSFTGIVAIRLSSEIWAKKGVTLLQKAPRDCKDGSQRIRVHLDTKKDLVIWRKDNLPDTSLMKQRERAQKTLTKPAKVFNKVNPNNHSSDSTRRRFQYGSATTSNDKNDTFGLSMEFLDTLSIKLPLRREVYVGNLSKQYDDELKIRQLFGHAGFIHSVTIVGRAENLALKVEYDHPVEAVQAISMLHDQQVFGLRLVVRMYSQSINHLPKGLVAFGPGLAADGLPLKGVRSNVELQSVQTMLMKQIETLSEKMKEMERTISGMRANQHSNTTAALTSTVANPLQSQLLALGSILNPQTIQMLQLLQQNTAANLGTAVNTDQGLNPQPVAAPKASDLLRNMQSPFGVTNMQVAANMQNGTNMQRGLNMQAGSNMQRGFNTQGVLNMQEEKTMPIGKYMQDRQIMPGGQNMQDEPLSRPSNMYGSNKNQNNYERGISRYRNNEEKSQNDDDDSGTVMFNYLPPSVTIDALKSKMKEVGDVKFAELTGQGRAIVVFRVPRNARSCIKLFHRTKVDGQTIDVRAL